MITSALIAAAAIPLLLAVGSGFLEFRLDVERTEETLGHEALTTARSAADRLQFLLDTTRSALRRLDLAGAEGRLDDRLIAIERCDLPFVAGLFVADSHGIVRHGTRAEIGTDLSRFRRFAEVRSGRLPVFIRAMRSHFAPEDVVALSTRRKGRDFRGVVGSRIRVAYLNGILAKYASRNLGDATFVLDRDGKILAAGGSLARSGASAPRHPLLLAAQQERSGWRKYEGPLLPGTRVGGFVTLPEPGWTVISSRNLASRVADLRSHWQGRALAAAATALLVAFLAVGLARRLTRPLEELTSVMRKQVSDGLTRNPVPSLPESDVATDVAEIADLVASFNALVAALNRRFVEVATFEELERLADDALEASRHKSEFVASMSHELRTPLNSIIGYSELILATGGERLDAVSRDNLEVILRSGRHLLGLINEILDLERIEIGKMNLYATTFSPALVLGGLIESAEPLARAKGVALIADLAEDVGLAETDEMRFRQVVLNLLANAVKFTPAGEIRVSLRAREGEHLVVDVRDTGIGIARERQESVFDEFHRASGERCDDSEGTGLGLAISRKLARLLGGDLLLESTVDRGSRFTLEIPLVLPVTVPGGVA